MDTRDLYPNYILDTNFIYRVIVNEDTFYGFVIQNIHNPTRKVPDPTISQPFECGICFEISCKKIVYPCCKKSICHDCRSKWLSNCPYCRSKDI